MAARIAQAEQEFDEGLADDLNTARALAAVHELIRVANVAMDKGEFRQGHVAETQQFLAAFDKVFAVLEDNDAKKLQALGYGSGAADWSDSEVEKLIADRTAAKKRRDFAAADRIRKELADRGIIVEDTKDGTVRWKRK
jgi:cysteinyl-tRNA synthetase